MSSSSLAVLIFDCDGVLLDSNDMKSECFRRTLLAHGCSVSAAERFIEFQRANFGKSRYWLFEAFASWELACSPRVDVQALLRTYTGELGDRYLTCSATDGMEEVIEGLARTFPLHIVSGSDEDELRMVMGARGYARWFQTILGSPRSKPDNLRRIIAANDVPSSDMWFVGDAEADFRAAQETGTNFIYVDRYGTARERMRALATEHGFRMISDLRTLQHILLEVGVAPAR